MEVQQSNSWNVGCRSGLVSIGSHKLFVSVRGPDRTPGEPVIVLITGVTSTISEWPCAIRLISQFARIVIYDRSGFGQSEVSPDLPSAKTIAAELTALLQATGITPPYITLAHSWGGILSSQFMISRPSDIAGMIFLDACAPDPTGRDNAPWKNSMVEALTAGVDYIPVTGITKRHVLSPEEWKAWMEEEASEKHGRQASLEMAEVDGSFLPIVDRNMFRMKPPTLGKVPVCVLKCHSEKDFQLLYAAGVEAGNGTEQERATFREMLGGWEAMELASQKQYLTLSETSHYMETKWCGHSVHLQEPEMVAEAVKWTLANLET